MRIIGSTLRSLLLAAIPARSQRRPAKAASRTLSPVLLIGAGTGEATCGILYLAGYLRRNDLSFEQAAALQAEAEALMAGHEFDVDSRTVLALVRDSGCSAYDCEFIALAQQLGTPLVTMDKKLLKAFPGCAMALQAG